MEKAKQTNVTMDDLFGPKFSSKSSSSTTLFGSIFGPPPPAHGKNPSHSDALGSSRKKDFEPDVRGTSGLNDEKQKSRGEFKNSIDENGTNIEPCYFNSSIYYGGQQMYSPTSSQNNNSKNIFKKDGGEVDSNENGSHMAPRGNWWQGSLYY